METCVLMPREMCLQEAPAAGVLRVVTASNLPQGTTFTPTSGTLRTDYLHALPFLHPCDPRHNWGCYDRLRETPVTAATVTAISASTSVSSSISSTGGSGGGLLRECNWVRFLSVWPHYTPYVNMVASLQAHNTITFTVTRNLPPDAELTAFLLHSEELVPPPTISPLSYQHPLILTFAPISPAGKPSDTSRLTATEGCVLSTGNTKEAGAASSLLVATALYRRAVQVLMQDAPLDLSKPLLGPRPVLTDGEERVSVSSSSSSSCSASDVFQGSNSDSCFRLNETFSKVYEVGSSLGLGPARRARERSLLTCHICGKIFDRPSLLKRHMRTHTGEKPHVCEVCGKGFSTSSSLNTHRRIHSGEKPHQCTTCGKRFTASSNLYYHKMTHVKDKPHKCGECARSFPTPGDLRCHTFVHTGQWPHRCPVCTKGFSKHTNLRNHLLLHSAEVKQREGNRGPGILGQVVR